MIYLSRSVNTNIIGFANVKFYGIPGPQLQAVIDVVDNWAKLNQMALNAGKCQLIHIGRKNPKYNYKIGGDLILPTSKVCDLGILVDDCLTFEQHALYVKKKCYRLINLMFKIFHSHDAHLYILFYTTYIFPIIDYSSFIYALNTVRNTDCLERISRYFTKRLWCRIHTTTIAPSYPVRLQ